MPQPWVLVLLVSAVAASTGASQSRNACNNRACLTASAYLHSNVDTSANPCSDFFQFACGGFLKSQLTTAGTVQDIVSATALAERAQKAQLFEVMFNKNLSRSGDANMNDLFDAARLFHTACVNWYRPDNEWSLRPDLLPRNWEIPCRESDLNSLAKPIIEFIEAFTDFEDFVARLIISGVSDLLQLEASLHDLLDMRHGGNSWLKLKIAAFKDIKSDSMSAEVQRIKRIIRLSGLNVTTSPLKLAVIQYKIISTFRRYRFALDLTRHYTAEELDALTHRQEPRLGFKWSRLLQHLSSHSGIAINHTTEILIKFRAYSALISELFELEAQVLSRSGSLYDFIRLNAVMSAFDDLTEKKRHANEAFSFFDSGSSLEAQSGVCLSKIITAMPIVVLEMFHSAYNANDTYETVKAMFSEIAQSMKRSVARQAWISDPTKRAIQQRLGEVNYSVSYPRQLVQELGEVFHGVANRVKRSRMFGEGLLAMNDAKFRNALWRITTERPLNETLVTFFDDLHVSMSYNDGFNTVLIQRGFLNSVLYDKDYPDYLLYGSVGSAIGHEIAHAFNRFQNADELILDNAESNALENKSFCLLAHYGALTKSQVGEFSSTNRVGTIPEIFSDIVGLNAAFSAYRASVTKSKKSGRSPRILPGPLMPAVSPDQMFFVQAAQLHCSKAEKEVQLIDFETRRHPPPRPRVNGQMMNSKDFASVFGCRPGDPMYLRDEDKCHFW